MSDTPRNNAAEAQAWTWTDEDLAVAFGGPGEHERRIQREIDRLTAERDEARSLVRTEQLRYLGEIERLREQVRNAYEFTKTLTAERDEARRECCNTWEAVMFRPAQDVAADKGWDCFKALEDTAREMYKGGD